MTRKQGIGVDEKSPRGTGWGVLAVLTVEGEVFVRKLMVWKTRKKSRDLCHFVAGSNDRTRGEQEREKREREDIVATVVVVVVRVASQK